MAGGDEALDALEAIERGRSLFAVGRLREAVDVLRRGAPADEHAELLLARARAVAYSRAGDHRGALAELESVPDRWRARGDRAAAADAESLRSQILLSDGDVEGAFDAGAEALVLLGEWEGLVADGLVEADAAARLHAANVHNSLGLVFRDLEAVGRAVAEFSQAVEWVPAGDTAMALVTRANLAAALLKQATLDQRVGRDADATFEQCERHARLLLTPDVPARRRLEAASLVVAARLHRGLVEEAATMLAAAEPDRAEVDDRLALVDWHLLHSWLAREQERWDDAVAHADEAVRLAERSGDLTAAPRARRDRARVRQLVGDLRGALTDLAAADDVARRLRTDRVEGLVEQLARRADLEAVRRRLERQTRVLDAERARLIEAVETDALTGVGNRRRLSATIGALRGLPPQEMAVLVIDLDRFKAVNDGHGHDVGDEVLVRVARAVVESSRERDVVCRVGGDEFVVLLPATDQVTAVHLAERIAERVGALGPVADGVPVPTVSIGVATGPSDDIPALLKRADDGLLAGKRRGRAAVVVVADPAVELIRS